MKTVFPPAIPGRRMYLYLFSLGRAVCSVKWYLTGQYTIYQQTAVDWHEPDIVSDIASLELALRKCLERIWQHSSIPFCLRPCLSLSSVEHDPDRTKHLVLERCRICKGTGSVRCSFCQLLLSLFQAPPELTDFKGAKTE